MDRRFVIALSGSSGSLYGKRLVEELVSTGALVHLIVSEAASKVWRHEMGVELDLHNGA